MKDFEGSDPILDGAILLGRFMEENEQAVKIVITIMCAVQLYRVIHFVQTHSSS